MNIGQLWQLTNTWLRQRRVQTTLAISLALLAPLLVFITEANHRKIALLDQRLGSNGIYLGGSMISPEVFIFRTQQIPRCVTRCVMGNGGGKINRKAILRAPRLDLLSPICVDFAR